MSIMRRAIFPFGIFFLMLISLCALSAGGIGLYYFLSLKNDIVRAENTAKGYLFPLIDACAQIASVCNDKKIESQLSPLFLEYRKNRIVAKAFFVKDNGFILAHSDPAEAVVLKHNIASDEFTYNVDQIFIPIKQNSKELFFSDYFLIERTIPFNKKALSLLKKYVDQNLDRNGWILSKAVYTEKDKPYGIVSFIVDKDDIYNAILRYIDEAKIAAKYALAGAIGFSLIISLLVFVRYRLIAGSYFYDEDYDYDDNDEKENTVAPESTAQKLSSLSGDKPEIYVSYTNDNKPLRPESIILDAIPIPRQK
jgi:hypothetical protein